MVASLDQDIDDTIPRGGTRSEVRKLRLRLYSSQDAATALLKYHQDLLGLNPGDVAASPRNQFINFFGDMKTMPPEVAQGLDRAMGGAPGAPAFHGKGGRERPRCACDAPVRARGLRARESTTRQAAH